MEFKRNNKRDVLGELRLSNTANLESSFKNTSNATEVRLSPESYLHSGENGFISAAQKTSSHLSNLELLTKVASRIKNNLQYEESSENIVLPSLQSKQSVDINCKPRKEKSLSILCDKFLKLYPLNVNPGNFMEISLEQATQFIGTDRRRIYDILIVLECLQMASKVCKNHYQWHGTQHLVGTLSQLKWLALRLNFFQNVNSVLMEDSSTAFEEYTNDTENTDLNVMDPFTINAQAQNIMHHNSELTPSTESDLETIKAESKEQKAEDDADFDLKDSSLGIMCQKFLMLFLVTSKIPRREARLVRKDIDQEKHKEAVQAILASPDKKPTFDDTFKLFQIVTKRYFVQSAPNSSCWKFKQTVITIDDAAKILLGDTVGLAKNCHKVKTKIRRLYDIANVLSSLELIKKVNVFGNTFTLGSAIRQSKRPAFQYIGPEVQPQPLPNDALINPQTTRHSLLGHPSHAACEKKSTRKRKPKNPCPLLPKPGNIMKENSARESSCGNKRSWLSAFPSGGRSVSGREKFPRSHSENCIKEIPHACGSLRSDILQVAELELKRIADEEQREKESLSTKKPVTPPASKNSVTTSKCNWKHYHSESCISVDNESEKGDADKNCSPKDVSWKGSILKHADSELSSILAKDMRTNSNEASNTQWQSCGSVRKDVSICIINGSSITNKVGGNFGNLISKSTVPIVIQSVHKNHRLRGISVNPVPISGSNCIVGPAYIIHQLPSTANGKLNPVSVSITKIERGSSNKGLGGITVQNNPVE